MDSEESIFTRKSRTHRKVEEFTKSLISEDFSAQTSNVIKTLDQIDGRKFGPHKDELFCKS